MHLRTQFLFAWNLLSVYLFDFVALMPVTLNFPWKWARLRRG